MEIVSTRRATLKGALALGACVLLARPARATPETLAAAMNEVLAGRTAKEGRITLEIPRLAESGLSVSLDVSVESPMTPEDHVKTIYLFAEKNPLPNIARFHMSHRTGRAQVATRVRLADTQMITALVEMSDGAFWRHAVEVVITIAACTEPA